MKTIFVFFKGILPIVIFASMFTSCANIIPPSGGAKDTIAPSLIAAFPKDSSLNFTSKKITLTFNEYVEAKDIQQNVIINPLPINLPTIEYKLQNVLISLKDTLEPNTTYTINFGNAIKDINEGNITNNKTYTFSTGKKIDNSKIGGKVILARDGKIDSTLIVVLHPNLNDSAVTKLRPKYLTKLNSEGAFLFTNLPKTTFNIFVLPNDYSKKYDDTTKLFGYLNTPVAASDTPTQNTIYVYREAEPAKQNTTQKLEQPDKSKEDKRLKYSLSLNNNKYDVLDSSLQIIFSRNIVLKNIDSIALVDTNYQKMQGYSLKLDSNKTNLSLKYNFQLNTKYILVLNKTAVADTNGMVLSKADTIRFLSFKQEDYGTVKLRINATMENTVLQIFKDDKLQMSVPITTKEIKQNLFRAGEYEVRILTDDNKNNIWDTGNYKQKKQPEKVITIKNKLIVRANWDNEMDIDW